MKFTRAWSMPNAETFSIPDIGAFVGRHTMGERVVVDPFARSSIPSQNLVVARSRCVDIGEIVQGGLGCRRVNPS